MTGSPVDVDWVVIGSGFGGSVAALRLVERGYSVCVLEAGQRFSPATLPRSSADLRRFFWMPRLGLRGILRIHTFRDLMVLSGCGVGGGSLVYGQTLYRATDRFRAALNATLGESVDLDRYYDVAERMLGVVSQTRVSTRDVMMVATAEELGYGAGAVGPAPVGVFRGEPGKSVPDPYFGGEGPDRTGCTDCGQCFFGCPDGAKNTLDKNYLWLAERRGAVIEANRQVTTVRALGASDGSDGYEVIACDPGSWLGRRRQVYRARGVVFAAGAIGTTRLLARCQMNGDLPRLSTRVGMGVRGNAESICAITMRDRSANLTDGVAITNSVFADQDLHIEAATYGGLGDSMGLFMMPLSGGGSRLTRPLKLAATILRHPFDFLRSANPAGWSTRSMIIGGMWNRDGAIRLEARRGLLGKGIRLRSHPDPDNPNPRIIPELHRFVRHLARQYDAIPQIWLTESFNKPVTVHILGGATIGKTPDEGVIDPGHRVFGYQNMLVCDGAAVPNNPGANPSLTITALAERALASLPAKDGSLHHGGIGYPISQDDSHLPEPGPRTVP